MGISTNKLLIRDGMMKTEEGSGWRRRGAIDCERLWVGGELRWFLTSGEFDRLTTTILDQREQWPEVECGQIVRYQVVVHEGCGSMRGQLM